MTGLWQISGRRELGFKEMVLLDLYYIENQSRSDPFGIGDVRPGDPVCNDPGGAVRQGGVLVTVTAQGW
jgi:hypothetical protein